MGMTSKHVASKRVHPDCEEEEVRKRAKPSLELPSHKDDARFKSPASPAPIQLKADGASKRPAEVFRTDFITAMKVPDNHTLAPGRNYELVDTWRQEWEKGVQVPVNPDILPKTFCREKEGQVHEKRYDAFSMPQARISYDSPELLHTSDKTAGCLYDLDDLDVKWLQIMRNSGKKGSIDESMMEKVMTYFERKCFENMAHAVATKKGLSIEYDETTICDVCLSPDTEENNEIVFCDACNICVHQACYGIPDIPTGTWLCRPCSRGVLSPPCIICPNRGGAMKRIKGSFEWIHVICAWWVPEVKIEDTDNVEKMTVDKIPASRKNLCCLLCREKIGACIQCSVKRCVVAYHVTCAVKEGLEMKTVMMQDKDDVQHISYCKRHCVPQPSEKSKPRVGDNVENQRLQELQKLQEKFFKLVSVKKSARELRLTKDITSKLFGYWVLKRKANENRPLIPLTTEQQEKLSGKQGIFLIQEQINVEVERYSLLRQDLERLRNLCYLIIRRERVKKEVHKASQDVFNKQNDILESEQSTLSEEEFNKIASGNELMRFTKFPSYSMYGPPFADHLGEEGTAEDETSSSGACFTDGGTVGLNSEPSCSYTSYTGDVAAVQPHTEASSSNTVSSGDGKESVDVTEVITMKDPDQQPPGNAMNDQGNTLEKLLTLNGMKKNLMEDAKEMSKSNLCPQNKAESSTETIANTDSIQNADNTKCKDTIKVVQKQTIDFGDGQSNFVNAPSESPKIETKSSWKVDTLNCVASEKSCRTPKRGPKGNKGQSSAVKRVLRSSPRDIKGTLDVELPVKEDIISRLGNTDLRSSVGRAEDDTVKCLNVHNEVKKRLGLNDAHKGVSRRPPRRITRSCDRSINLDLCEADSSISQGQEHRNQKPNEFTENRDSRTNVGFDKQDSIAVDTQETANVHCSDTPGDSLSYSCVVTKLLEQSEVIEQVSTDVLNNSDLLIDKNLETNIDESSPAADIPNGKVDPDFKVDANCSINPDCKVDANCSINPDCKVDANCSINPDCKVDANCSINSDCKVDANCNINSDCKVDLETDQVENDNKDDELRSGKVDCLTSSSEPENATQAAFNIEKESRNDPSVMENRSLENREKCSNQDSSSEVCVQPDAKDTLSTETAVLETDNSSGIKKCAQENIEDMKHQDLTSKVCSEPEVKDSTTIETGAPETDTSTRNVTETTRDHEDIIRENVDLKPASVSLSTEPELEPSSTSQATTPVAESPLIDKPAAESPLVDTPAAESSHLDTPAAESSLIDKPAAKSSLIDKPAAKSPLVDTPAAKSSLIGKPAAESSLIDKPAAESPLVDKPAAESSLIDKPAAKSPLVDTLAAESSLIDKPAAESPLVDTPAAESPLVNALQLCFEQQALQDDETGTAEGSFNEEITDDFQTTTTISANHTIVNGNCSESSFSQKENDSPNNDTTTLPKIESSCTETKDGPDPAVSRRLSFDIERRDETFLNDRNFFDRFMDSSKNPVVLLNELSAIERMKEDRPNDLNGLNSSPRKTKKISDAPSPAFPHTVIDDLIACPQRLTRGRTQLMMMDEHRSALSRRNRRKSHHFTNQKSDPDIPRLTRRRLRSFGLEKLDLINNDLMNEVGMTSSYSPRKRNIESDTKNTLNGNTELEDVFLKDVSKTSALEEITGSPTRLTRARVRSLGLGYGEG